MRPACARALLYMKRFWQIFLSGLLALFASCPALAAQDEAGFIVSGKKAGTVPFEQIGGVPYVDTQKTARKFGASVELFAKSKQAKVSTKGFYAILTAPLQEIVVNAQAKTLSAPVLVRGGKIMTPAEFFNWLNLKTGPFMWNDAIIYPMRKKNLAAKIICWFFQPGKM